MMNEIKRRISQGEVITHVLHVHVARQDDDTYNGDYLRQHLLRRLKDVTYNRTVEYQGEESNVTLTWKTSKKQTSQYYYTCVKLSNDIAVILATRQILQDIVNSFEYELNDMGLGYCVFKPCSMGFDKIGSPMVIKQHKSKKRRKKPVKKSKGNQRYSKDGHNNKLGGDIRNYFSK